MSTILPTILQGEIVLLPPGGFSFANRLQQGEVLAGTPTVSATVYSGTDPSPSAVLSGAAQVVDGNTVQQLFTGGLPGVIYMIVVGCGTSLGQYLKDWGYLVVLPSSVAPPSGNILLLPGGAPLELPGGATIPL
jgi:hypothetical protein